MKLRLIPIGLSAALAIVFLLIPGLRGLGRHAFEPMLDMWPMLLILTVLYWPWMARVSTGNHDWITKAYWMAHGILFTFLIFGEIDGWGLVAAMAMELIIAVPLWILAVLVPSKP